MHSKLFWSFLLFTYEIYIILLIFCHFSYFIYVAPQEFKLNTSANSPNITIQPDLDSIFNFDILDISEVNSLNEPVKIHYLSNHTPEFKQNIYPGETLPTSQYYLYRFENNALLNISLS